MFYGNIRFVYVTLYLSLLGIVILLLGQFIEAEPVSDPPIYPPILTVAGASVHRMATVMTSGIAFVEHVSKHENNNDRYLQARVGRIALLTIALGAGFVPFHRSLVTRLNCLLVRQPFT
jgi:hypothetical protein